MGEGSAIEWTDHTFNPWWGCTKISVGPQGACEHCYAETWARRVGMPELWQERYRLFGAKHWNEPLKWNKAAEHEGRSARVFCASMADVFDNDAPESERAALWALIERTPHLTWQLLTKRIGNAVKMLPSGWLEHPLGNVWIGATVATQEEAERDIPKLLAIPAAVRFLSCEPLLGAINLRRLHVGTDSAIHRAWGIPARHDHFDALHAANRARVDWVIIGGESGPRARPFVLGWGKDIVRQCREAGIACFVKQVGARPVNREGEPCPHILDRKGKVMEEWPEELRVRQFPTPPLGQSDRTSQPARRTPSPPP